MLNKYQAIFRSRWRALFWSAGVLLTAYCSVPSPDEKDPAAELLKQVAAQQHEVAPARHVNPWAISK